MNKFYKILLCSLIIIFISGCNNNLLHKHTWEEATCTKPQTCTECGETIGETLGHSTNIGMCSRCGEKINEELVLDIVSISGKISTITNKAFSYVDSASYYTNYSKYNLAYNELMKVTEYLEEIIDICGDYIELSKLKDLTQKVINNLPSKPKSSSSDDLVEFLEEYKNCLIAFKNLYEELSNVSGLFIEDKEKNEI